MNSFWKDSVMNFLRDWLVVAEAKKLWTSIVFLIVLDHLLGGAFIRGNYQQVIPEWLGSILKRAAFFIVTNLLQCCGEATIFFFQLAQYKSQFRKQPWISKTELIIGRGSAIINGRFVLITLCLGMVYAPNKGKGIETHLPDVHSLGT